MNDNIEQVDTEIITQEKKKQRAGLNGVRPDGYIEDKFKDMAKDSNLSQTKLFEKMFWNYITDSRGEKRENSISFDAELSLLSNNLESIMQNVKSIATKSQDTVISLETNKDQIQKNLDIEIQTLNLKLDEIRIRNIELENTNNVFNEVKENLEAKIVTLTDNIQEAEIKNNRFTEDMRVKESKIVAHEKAIELLEKDKKDLNTENAALEEKIIQRNSKINNLESVNVSLQNTLNSMETLRKSEISSIEARYKTEIIALSAKINNNNAEKEKEIINIKNSIKAEYEADKKISVAEVILDLADMKEKYAKLQGNYNELQKKSVKKQRG